MKLRTLVCALLAAGWACGASAVSINTYTGAKLVAADTGDLSLLGFGRTVDGLVGPREEAATLRFSPSLLAVRDFFFDTWNVDVSGAHPGTYSFSNWTINATGTALFSLVSLSSIDEAGKRNSVVFDINAAGTQAVGSGTFTVRSSCPIQSCLWIDVYGTQEIGGGPAGYGDNGKSVATLVPEPATYGLMALGLAAVGFAARRRAA